MCSVRLNFVIHLLIVQQICLINPLPLLHQQTLLNVDIRLMDVNELYDPKNHCSCLKARPDGAVFAARFECEYMNTFSVAFFDAARHERPSRRSTSKESHAACAARLCRACEDVFSAKPHGISTYLNNFLSN
jgi:hypothetical protein|uniref:Secreted protein n=1 Tax=Sipha flava TaxID=143950 RepID=A0A2S2QJ97_9HEMI